MECQFCKETIQDGAMKCKHCGSMLNQQQEQAPGVQQVSQSAAKECGYNMFDWYKKVVTNYAVFNGRARRKEYWYFGLVSFLMILVVGFIGGLIGKGMLLYNLYNLAVLLPTVAVGVRRLHDSNRSGWWLLLPVVNLIMLLQDSTYGPNKYGPSPKMAGC